MQEHNQNLYLSFDIEADGQSPAQHNMLSFGLSVLDDAGQEIAAFECNILEQDGHTADPRTMEEFWAQHPDAWEATRHDRQTPAEFVRRLVEFLASLPPNARRRWVAKPAAYDWQWLNAYFHSYRDRAQHPLIDIGFKADCISTMLQVHLAQRGIRERAAVALECERLSGRQPHTHRAIDDARQQARLFYSLGCELRCL